MLLSIITINYNNATGLKKTMQSVVNQTWSDFEYIVMDGNSSDNSVAIIKEFNFANLTWISEPDTGIYNAMNKGIKHAKGEYLLFLNSGDILNGVTALNDFIQHPNFVGDIIYGDYKFDKGEKIYPDVLTPFNLFKASLPHQSSFIKRILFYEYGFYDERFKIVSDKAFYIKCLLSNKVVFNHIKYHLSLIDLNGVSNNIKNKELLEKENNLMLKEYFNIFYSDYKLMIENQKEIIYLRKKILPEIIIKILKKINFYLKRNN